MTYTNARHYTYRRCHRVVTFMAVVLFFRVFGSYQALESGSCYEALVDFTGGIGEELNLADYPLPGGLKLFPRLKRLAKRNTLLCAAIYNIEGTGELTLNTGLVAGHAYSITDLVRVRSST